MVSPSNWNKTYVTNAEPREGPDGNEAEGLRAELTQVQAELTAAQGVRAELAQARAEVAAAQGVQAELDRVKTELADARDDNRNQKTSQKWINQMVRDEPFGNP